MDLSVTHVLDSQVLSVKMGLAVMVMLHATRLISNQLSCLWAGDKGGYMEVLLILVKESFFHVKKLLIMAVSLSMPALAGAVYLVLTVNIQ